MHLAQKRANRTLLTRSLRTDLHPIWPGAWDSMEVLEGPLDRRLLEMENHGQFRSSNLVPFVMKIPNSPCITSLHRMGSERSASSVYLDNDSDAGSDASGPTSYSATAGSSSVIPKSNRGPGRRE